MHLPPAFFEVHRDLPREGPGSPETTLRALSAARAAATLGEPERVADMGCGPGQQTLVLAEQLGAEARVIGVDPHAPFLAQLERSARERGVAERIHTARCSMLDYAPEAPLDLIWSEGAVYIVGLERALPRFAELLRPGGAVAFSEPCYTSARPPPEVVEIFSADAPEMGDVDTTLERVRRAGLTVRDHFLLDHERDWRRGYYAPLAARVEALARRADEDDALAAALEETRAEIALFESHGDCFSYVFIIAS